MDSPPKAAGNGIFWLVAVFLFYAVLVGIFMARFFPVWTQAIPGGLEDTRLFLWNAWWFHRATHLLHVNPFHTDLLFHPFGCSLITNDSPLWNNLVTEAAQRWGANLNAACNVWLFLSWTLAGFCVYGLAWEVTRRRGPALVAGLYVMTNSYLLARALQNWGQFNLWGIALFLWLALRALRTRRRRDYGLAGLAWAWTAACHYYFLIYTGLIALGWCAMRYWPRRYRLAMRSGGMPLWGKLCGALSALAGLIAAWIIFGHPHDIVSGGIKIGLQTPANVAMAGWIALAAAIVSRWRLQSDARLTEGKRETIRAALWMGGVALVLLSPLLLSSLALTLHGDYPRQSILWRTHLPGANLTALFFPNPVHAWWGAALSRWLMNHGIQPQDQAAQIGWVCLAVVFASGCLRKPNARLRRWLALAAAATVFALGVYLHIFNVNLWLPLPFYLLRLIPLIGNAKVPERWMAVGSIAWGVVLALALTSWAERKKIRLNLICAVVAAAILLENWPGVPLGHATADSSVYAELRALPRGGVLALPFQIGDSTINAGDALPSAWNFPWDLLGAQIYHEQPILGGYIGRVPKRLVRAYQSDPFFHALIALEEGEAPSAIPAGDGCRVAREFGIAYVLSYPSAVRPAALAFIRNAVPLDPVRSADGVELAQVRCPA